MILSSIISSNKTIRQSTPPPGSGRAAGRPVQVCWCKTYSNHSFSLRKMTQHPHREPHRVKTARHLCQGPHRVNAARPRLLRPMRGSRPGHFDEARSPGEKIAAIIEPLDLNADWQRPISKYLQLATMPEDKTKTRRLARRAKGYLIPNDELYCCSPSGILQWCIPTEEGKALLLDIHKGVC
jgi:hypothetical protein